MVYCMADSLVGTMWCFFLDACLIVVVAGSDDVLQAGIFLARHVQENWLLRYAAVLSDALSGGLSVPTVVSGLQGTSLDKTRNA